MRAMAEEREKQKRLDALRKEVDEQMAKNKAAAQQKKKASPAPSKRYAASTSILNLRDRSL